MSPCFKSREYMLTIYLPPHYNMDFLVPNLTRPDRAKPKSFGVLNSESFGTNKLRLSRSFSPENGQMMPLLRRVCIVTLRPVPVLCTPSLIDDPKQIHI